MLLLLLLVMVNCCERWDAKGAESPADDTSFLSSLQDDNVMLDVMAMAAASRGRAMTLDPVVGGCAVCGSAGSVTSLTARFQGMGQSAPPGAFKPNRQNQLNNATAEEKGEDEVKVYAWGSAAAAALTATGAGVRTPDAFRIAALESQLAVTKAALAVMAADVQRLRSIVPSVSLRVTPSPTPCDLHQAQAPRPPPNMLARMCLRAREIYWSKKMRFDAGGVSRIASYHVRTTLHLVPPTPASYTNGAPSITIIPTPFRSPSRRTTARRMRHYIPEQIMRIHT